MSAVELSWHTRCTLQFGIKASRKYDGQVEQEGIYAKKASTTKPKLIDFVEEEIVLVNDPLFLRVALKDYIDKHDRSSKKGLMKSYAVQTPAPAKEETVSVSSLASDWFAWVCTKEKRRK